MKGRPTPLWAWIVIAAFAAIVVGGVVLPRLAFPTADRDVTFADAAAALRTDGAQEIVSDGQRGQMVFTDGRRWEFVASSDEIRRIVSDYERTTGRHVDVRTIPSLGVLVLPSIAAGLLPLAIFVLGCLAILVFGARWLVHRVRNS